RGGAARAVERHGRPPAVARAGGTGRAAPRRDARRVARGAVAHARDAGRLHEVRGQAGRPRRVPSDPPRGAARRARAPAGPEAAAGRPGQPGGAGEVSVPAARRADRPVPRPGAEEDAGVTPMRHAFPVLLLLAVPAFAQPPAAVRKLTVTAAAESTPALKFTL